LDKKLNINESFICKIWESAGEYLTTLKTADGNEVEVIDYGKKNFDSGPDYLDAVIKIGGKVKDMLKFIRTLNIGLNIIISMTESMCQLSYK